MVLKRRKKRGRNLSRIEEKKRKENEHHGLTLNVSSDWSKPIEKFSPSPRITQFPLTRIST